MIEVGSYCCSFVEKPFAFVEHETLTEPRLWRFFGRGIGVMNLGIAPAFDELLREEGVGHS